MAAWYNGTQSNILDISKYDFNPNEMLKPFWRDLIGNNLGRIVYFHNWGGYDSILSMPALLSLGNYTFEPVVNQGEIMALTVKNDKIKKR
jgi:hypothetical protein